MECLHANVECLNDFEQIRKYRCRDCGHVMMCECDADFGTRLLSHQLKSGCEHSTRRRVPVTLGFQPRICRECQGLAPESHPKAAIYGRSSKIQRYYWREIQRRRLELFAEWAEANGVHPILANTAVAKAARKVAGKQALLEIKRLHASTPKHVFAPEESQADLIATCDVEVVRLDGVYVRDPNLRRARILCGENPVSAEEYACLHFQRLGYECFFIESRPFHVLFGVLMWLVIQDPDDERVRIVGFGDRTARDEGRPGREIRCHLPEDFGSAGYGERRQQEIDTHFRKALKSESLDWLFDYWLEPSERLRQYLWAHDKNDVQSAKRILQVLPKDVVLRVMRYLADSYWQRYLGWPDLLLVRGTEYCFVEVKSSNDELSDAQKRWIRDNHRLLKLPFKLVKIHRTGVVDRLVR